jgi:hypothetical protein
LTRGLLAGHDLPVDALLLDEDGALAKMPVAVLYQLSYVGAGDKS